MIIDWSKVRILLRPGHTDFRKDINGLSALVVDEMKADLFSNCLFLFCSRNKKCLKILYWDKNGFCLWKKKLEEDRFPWPKDTLEARELSYTELSQLLCGIDFFRAHKRLKYREIK